MCHVLLSGNQNMKHIPHWLLVMTGRAYFKEEFDSVQSWLFISHSSTAFLPSSMRAVFSSDVDKIFKCIRQSNTC